jgi:hypothetical protein
MDRKPLKVFFTRLVALSPVSTLTHCHDAPGKIGAAGMKAYDPTLSMDDSRILMSPQERLALKGIQGRPRANAAELHVRQGVHVLWI